MSRLNLNGKTAVITGAAGGIGRELASVMARRGCNLALADINAARLRETAEPLASNAVRVSYHHLDVTDFEAVAAFPALVQAHHPGVDILINNAGVALGGTFEQVTETDFDWLFDVNFHGLVRMTRAFMPMLRQSDDARIVNLSSIFGIMAPPGQAAYSASKFAVRGFSEALRHELMGSSIGVTIVHPGGIDTDIARNSRRPPDVEASLIDAEEERFNRLLTLPPATAAATIVKAIENRRNRVLVGNDARALAFFVRLLPVSYWKLFNRFA